MCLQTDILKGSEELVLLSSVLSINQLDVFIKPFCLSSWYKILHSAIKIQCITSLLLLLLLQNPSLEPKQQAAEVQRRGKTPQKEQTSRVLASRGTRLRGEGLPPLAVPKMVQEYCSSQRCYLNSIRRDIHGWSNFTSRMLKGL